MDVDSDNDSDFEVGRRRTSPNTSRGSSPAAKRQKLALSPTSQDDNITVPIVLNEDAETLTSENAPLIRQAVGFSSISAGVNTYQATVAPQPIVPYFLPGQAPPPPPQPKPKPKPSKPRAPRKKKGEHFSSQTNKFKLCSSASSRDSGFTSLASSRDSANISPSSGPPHSVAASGLMIPVTCVAIGGTNNNIPTSSSYINGGTNGMTSDDSLHGVQRTRKSSKRKAPTSRNDTFSRPGIQPSLKPPALAPNTTSPQHPPNVNPEGPLVERFGQTPARQSARLESPCPGPGSTPAGLTNPPTTVTQNSAQNISKPLRMVTLLIEDTRGGAPDLQLAEVKVPLRVANDPEDGFWADAAEICEALQSGPSRIDGAAKVCSMRGRFRQFFMRINQFDQLQVQSAHIAISKERTLNVFVEALVPQGQLPRPSVPPSDVRPAHNSSSEYETMATRAETYSRPTYSLATRDDQIERLSKSSYVVAQGGRYSPASDSGSYGHSRRTTSPQRPSRHDQYASPGRYLTPPIPGRYADTQEEKDEAIANYIRSHIENHPGWMDYMQSRAKPQRVSEVLKQYTFVEDRVRELIGRRTPAHWDGAPSSCVERHHIWRVLRLDSKWGEECEETLLLLGFYGKCGSRYEDSRVVDMINDTSLPGANTIQKFLRLLREVDDNFARDALCGQFAPTSP